MIPFLERALAQRRERKAKELKEKEGRLAWMQEFSRAMDVTRRYNLPDKWVGRIMEARHDPAKRAQLLEDYYQLFPQHRPQGEHPQQSPW